MIVTDAVAPPQVMVSVFAPAEAKERSALPEVAIAALQSPDGVQLPALAEDQLMCAFWFTTTVERSLAMLAVAAGAGVGAGAGDPPPPDPPPLHAAARVSNAIDETRIKLPAMTLSPVGRARNSAWVPALTEQLRGADRRSHLPTGIGGWADQRRSSEASSAMNSDSRRTSSFAKTALICWRTVPSEVPRASAICARGVHAAS